MVPLSQQLPQITNKAEKLNWGTLLVSWQHDGVRRKVNGSLSAGGIRVPSSEGLRKFIHYRPLSEEHDHRRFQPPTDHKEEEFYYHSILATQLLRARAQTFTTADTTFKHSLHKKHKGACKGTAPPSADTLPCYSMFEDNSSVLHLS